MIASITQVRVSQRQLCAIREKQREECVSRAIQMMTLPLGLEADEGGYYLEMYRWLYHELVGGRTPAGVPAKRLEEWKKLGAWRLGHGMKRAG